MQFFLTLLDLTLFDSIQFYLELLWFHSLLLFFNLAEQEMLLEMLSVCSMGVPSHPECGPELPNPTEERFFAFHVVCYLLLLLNWFSGVFSSNPKRTLLPTEKTCFVFNQCVRANRHLNRKSQKQKRNNAKRNKLKWSEVAQPKPFTKFPFEWWRKGGGRKLWPLS